MEIYCERYTRQVSVISCLIEGIELEWVVVESCLGSIGMKYGFCDGLYLFFYCSLMRLDRCGSIWPFGQVLQQWIYPLADLVIVGDISFYFLVLHFRMDLAFVPTLAIANILIPVTMFRLWSNTHHDQENDSLQHESKINELKAAIGPLSGHSLRYCTDACFRRYLEARNWNVDKAKKMLEDTLEWRSTYKPEKICWPEVAIEGETGKIYRANFHDRQGRTVLILRPGMQNTKSIDNQMRHLAYLIENAILNLPEGQEQMAWLIDFTGLSINNTPPIKSARDTVNILQSHYPERLAVAFLYNPPRIFEAFWRIVKYFLDAKTFQKVKFVYPNDTDSVELMRSYFDHENLPTEFGGRAILEYDHEEFSRLMTEDDVKAASFWGFDKKLQEAVNGHHGSEVAPEPIDLASPAS
ncbi:unnamed protein product [Dovyalis caffra]|uniref:CRAL-TRIO domain-containing protein n=1 Tax=Dovyalis caffra TaxID=77055 RepID=A0AAV1SE57_9ROSI|nr:unnamed protein product [Dovyalis caffra]